MSFPGAAASIGGFQGSETTTAEVIFYSHSDDPIVLSAEGFGFLRAEGRRITDKKPGLLGINTSKVLGSASGSFTITLKPSQSAESLFKRLVDDDWVDIVFYKHDKPWHVMRGLIDDIRRATVVGGNGATTQAFNIVGRDFGKIWEMTPVWFDPIASSLITEGVSRYLFQADGEIRGNPGQLAIIYLKRFMEEIEFYSGVNWIPPPTMPRIVPGSFLNSVEFNTLPGTDFPKYFQNVPQRELFFPSDFSPQGTLWDLAHQHSDPYFTEMWVDVLPNGDPYSRRLGNSDSMTTLESKMAVVMRDKPFPFVADADLNLTFLPVWYDLPTFVVQRQELVGEDVGRSGMERFNAFYLATRLRQEDMAQSALNLSEPTIDRQSIKRHGLRRMDVQTDTTPVLPPIPGLGVGDISLLGEFQRNLLVNWYCMNPYFLSGTLTLGRGRPDIRIGCKVHIPGKGTGPLAVVPEQVYYVEQVNHSWMATKKMTTTLGVTRGWEGTDAEYLGQLTAVKSRFTKEKAFWTG
ncbi:MAG: hypothetical protein GWN86_14755 [Desulfobacterales bacterium]|nr:hypothetical protein [Desulfobacterales bacterium]